VLFTPADPPSPNENPLDDLTAPNALTVDPPELAPLPTNAEVLPNADVVELNAGFAPKPEDEPNAGPVVDPLAPACEVGCWAAEPNAGVVPKAEGEVPNAEALAPKADVAPNAGAAEAGCDVVCPAVGVPNGDFGAPKADVAPKAGAEGVDWPDVDEPNADLAAPNAEGAPNAGAVEPAVCDVPKAEGAPNAGALDVELLPKLPPKEKPVLGCLDAAKALTVPFPFSALPKPPKENGEVVLVDGVAVVFDASDVEGDEVTSPLVISASVSSACGGSVRGSCGSFSSCFPLRSPSCFPSDSFACSAASSVCG